MNCQTILLTGATGFLGSHLLEALVLNGYSVIIIKRSYSNIWRIQHLNGKYKSYDIDKVSIASIFENHQIEIVIHTACNYGRDNESVIDVLDSNLLFSLSVLEACIKSSTRLFINTDTFFNNNNYNQSYLGMYALSKKQFVDWLKYYSGKLQVINLKLQHVYGSKDDISKFIPWVISKLENREDDIKLTRGEQLRDFIHVDDVVSAYLKLLSFRVFNSSFKEFDIGTGQLISVRDFIEKLKLIFEKNRGESKTNLDFGALPYRDGEIMSVFVDNKDIIELGWVPNVNLEHCLEKLFRAN